MKITTLIENTLEENKSLINEHGLSMFIETEEGNILFDTGQTGDFIRNAKNLNVDLNNTKYLVLSHAHYNHCGGVKKLLETIDSKPELYVSDHFFKNSHKYRILDKNNETANNIKETSLKYIGINFNKSYLLDNNIDINYLTSDFIELTSKRCTNFFINSTAKILNL